MQEIADKLPASPAIDTGLRFANESVQQLQPDIDSLAKDLNSELTNEQDLLQRQKELNSQLSTPNELSVETINQLRHSINEFATTENQVINERQFVRHDVGPQANVNLMLQRLSDLESKVQLNEKFATLKTALEVKIRDASNTLNGVKKEGLKPIGDANESHKLLIVSFYYY